MDNQQQDDRPRRSGKPSELDQVLFRELLREGRKRTYARGAVLFHQGAHSDHVLLIEEGLAKVTSMSMSGYVSVLAFRGPGELVGEFAAIDGKPRAATCTAVEPLVTTVVTARRFLSSLASRPELALALLRRTVSRIREADNWRSEFGGCSATDRVVLVLDSRARHHGRPVPGEPKAVAVMASHREIAGAAGTSRDSVIRTLRTLQAEKILYTRRECVVVTDLPALAARAAPHRF
ncbi:Crp/Fnr family transcriptional regulator [Micromonospora sp. NPDC049523]|uniref:Crp/Fnr family transcriptional regulator n=1 Tax=Micromonospora sp. NPDC049523 TaxID=3155921 RepID=UPI0034138E76